MREWIAEFWVMCGFGLMCGVGLMCGAGPACGQIILNEFLAAPSGTQVEYVEVWNAGPDPVEGSRLELADARQSWSGLEGTDTIPPGDYLVLVPDRDAACAFGLPCDLVRELRPWPSLNNGGDSLFLRLDGRIVERIGYAGAMVESGYSQERVSPEVPADLGSNWRTGPEGGTPGARNAAFRLDRTAPVARAAEWDAGIIVWFSEPLDPASSSDIRILIDGLPAPETRVVASRIMVNWPSLPDRVEVEGARDYSGNASLREILKAARPARMGDVRLTEVLVEDGGPFGCPEFVEVTAMSDGPVSLRGAWIEIGVDTPDRFSFAPPDSTLLLDPGASIVFSGDPKVLVLSGETFDIVRATGLSLSNDGVQIRVVADSGDLLDQADLSPFMNDDRFQDHRGRSLRRVTTGTDVYSWASTLDDGGASPGRADRFPEAARSARPGNLILTEVMFDPLQDEEDGRPDQVEYLEWINLSDDPVSTMGLFVAFPPDETGRRDSIRVGYQPENLPPGGVMLIFKVPSALADNSLSNVIELAFPDSQPADESRSDALRIPIRSDLHLTGKGRVVQLFGPGSTLISSTLYAPGMHHPALADTKGHALERRFGPAGIDAPGPLSTSTSLNGGTPGWIPGLTYSPPTESDGAGAYQVDVEPTSFYPEDPALQRSTVVHVTIPSSEKQAAVIQASIWSMDGLRIRTLTSGTFLDAHWSAGWTGIDDAGRLVPAGVYVILVSVSQDGSAHARSFRRPVAVLRR